MKNYNKHFEQYDGEVDNKKIKELEEELEKERPKIDRVRDIPYYERETLGVQTLEHREKLHNAALGNQNCLGYKHTKEHNKYLSKLFTGRKNPWTVSSNIMNKGFTIYCFELEKAFPSVRQLEKYMKDSGEVFNRKHFLRILNDATDNFEYRDKHYKRIAK